MICIIILFNFHALSSFNNSFLYLKSHMIKLILFKNFFVFISDNTLFLPFDNSTPTAPSGKSSFLALAGSVAVLTVST